MRQEHAHLSDPELVLAIDGEVSARERKRIQSHLAECQMCRARKQELELAADTYAEQYREQLPDHLPPEAGPRALLKARLLDIHSGQQARNETRSNFAVWTGRASYVATTLAAAAIVLATLQIRTNFSAARLRASAVPQSYLTPGAVRMVSLQDLCGPQAESDENARTGGNVRFIAAVQSQVFRKYGMSNAKREAYEVDYLITPALGGADDLRNLWPEPYSSTAWNAHVKDKLESRLHDMVCAGQVDLATAQSDIATNWIAAYKKYFGTDRPSDY